MQHNHARNLTPPGSKLPASGAYKMVEAEDVDEPTYPSIPSQVQGQQFFSIFDSLNANDKQKLIALVVAYGVMHPDDRSVIVAAAERMAGI